MKDNSKSVEDIIDPLHAGFVKNIHGRMVFAIALVFSLYQLSVAVHLIDLSSQVQRALHVGFLLLMLFGLMASYQKNRYLPYLFWALGLTGFLVGYYQLHDEVGLIQRAGELNQLDSIVGVVSLAILFYGSYLLIGWSLPILCGAFIAYCLLGQFLPSPLNHRGYALDQVLEIMAFGTEGIYGTPTYVSANYIFLFILFGSFLERAGMIKLFTDIAMALFGASRGGPAKVAVFASGLMGTISGSGVANVVTVGQFTIPLMKKFGYSGAFAGGVESVASMGGQIMPPVMGAVAFIMAETLGVPYSTIVHAAIVPAFLYYFSAFWMVHCEACAKGLKGLSRDELPSLWFVLSQKWYLLIPLVALVYMLFHGFTPLYAGTIGLFLTAILILAGSAILQLNQTAMRVIAWVFLGLITASFLQFGQNILLMVIGGLIAVNFVVRGGRQTLQDCVWALADGARNAIAVGVACAIVGIIIATVSLTGVATTFGQFVINIGQHSLFLSLLLTMVMCIILGTGLPTIPNYIVTAALAGPALLKLGVPLIISHMFVFYFGIFADLSPPVALACFAAAPIAKETQGKIANQAMRIAIAGFVVPFIAVYNPELMLQTGGRLTAEIGYYPAVVVVITNTILAIGLWGVAMVGHWQRHMNKYWRIFALVGSFAFVLEFPYIDFVGYMVVLAIIYQQFGKKA